MGYSMTKAASDTLDIIKRELTKNYPDEKKTQTGWKVRDNSYFFEVERQDQKDGGILGNVWKLTDDGSRCTICGEGFRITGDGLVARFPALPASIRDLLNCRTVNMKEDEEDETHG